MPTSTTPPDTVRERIELIIIASNVMMDRIMHAADMFEPFKTLVDEPATITGFIKPGETTESCIAKTRKVIEDDGEYRVVAIWRVGHAEGAYYDPTIRVISTGTQWGMFRPALRDLGFPVELPKHEPLPS